MMLFSKAQVQSCHSKNVSDWFSRFHVHWTASNRQTDINQRCMCVFC